MKQGVGPVTTRNRLLAFVLLLLVGSACPRGAAVAEALPGQALVRVDPDQNLGCILTGTGIVIADSIPGSRLYLVRFSPTVSFDTKRQDLAGRPGISAVWANEPMHLVETHQMSIGVPEDEVPVFVRGVEPQNYYAQPAAYSIGLDSALLVSRGAGVRIAVIDGGVDCSHPLFADLNDSLARDFVDNDADPSEGPGTLRGHGTFVAGLIRLAAPEAELMVVRAFTGDGVSTTFQVAQALDWAVSHGAGVVNMSFGTAADNGVLAQACARAVQAGAVLAASVGNDGIVTPMYPASYPYVLAVTAIDTLDLAASFSNGSPEADVCAPGVDIYSALPAPYYWGTWSGTSFSTPLVTAVAGLVRAVRPTLTPQEMETHIRSTAARELAWGTVAPPDLFYGYGRLDAFTAVLLFRLGDMDNSWVVDVVDLNTVTAMATTGATPPNSIRRQGDINSDGTVDAEDVVELSDELFGGDQ